MNQANMTARLLGYLRQLMNADPVVRKAGLRGPEHLEVSSERKGGVMVAYLKTGGQGRDLPPLKVPVPLLVGDTRNGYNGVKQCVYGWLETNMGAGKRPARSRPEKGGKPGPLDN